jgi:hypothetical protein
MVGSLGRKRFLGLDGGGGSFVFLYLLINIIVLTNDLTSI